MYKLVALDIDGTILNSEHRVTEHLRETLKRVKERGVELALLSGRPDRGLNKIIRELDVIGEGDYVAAFNGGSIRRYGEEPFFKRSMSSAEYREIFGEITERLGYDMHFMMADKIIMFRDDPTGISMQEVRFNEVEYEALTVDEVERRGLEVVKVMSVNDRDKTEQLIREMDPGLYEKYSVVRTALEFLEFNPKGVDKGFAVEKIAENLGIDMSEVIAIGDSGNDEPMIKAAGLGIAMGNALDFVKESADYITETNDDEGVAKALYKFILDRQV